MDLNGDIKGFSPRTANQKSQHFFTTPKLKKIPFMLHSQVCVRNIYFKCNISLICLCNNDRIDHYCIVYGSRLYFSVNFSSICRCVVCRVLYVAPLTEYVLYMIMALWVHWKTPALIWLMLNDSQKKLTILMIILSF